MDDLPKILKPEKIIEEISNIKTGEKYKNDEEWKAKGIPESDIERRKSNNAES